MLGDKVDCQVVGLDSSGQKVASYEVFGGVSKTNAVLNFAEGMMRPEPKKVVKSIEAITVVCELA